MRILTIINGNYGERHLNNIQRFAPKEWEISLWQAPSSFPIVIDYPEDFLPTSFNHADLILSFGEHKGIAELLPDIAQMTKAKAVIVGVDNEAWLPRGLARQLRDWLKDIDVECATPKPLCSLTEEYFMISRSEKIFFNSPYIKEFAKFFGMPNVHLFLDKTKSRIASVTVIRDAVCGNCRYIAKNLVGVEVADSVEKTGLLHHHYPCLASMVKDADFNLDTLMHVSGNFIKDNVREQIKPFLGNQYLTPNEFVNKDLN